MRRRVRDSGGPVPIGEGLPDLIRLVFGDDPAGEVVATALDRNEDPVEALDRYRAERDRPDAA